MRYGEQSIWSFSAEELGAAIRADPIALGRTQEWVAQQCKIRRKTVADLEQGKNAEVFALMAVLNSLDKGLKITDRRMCIEEAGEFFKEDD